MKNTKWIEELDSIWLYTGVRYIDVINFDLGSNYVQIIRYIEKRWGNAL